MFIPKQNLLNKSTVNKQSILHSKNKIALHYNTTMKSLNIDIKAHLLLQMPLNECES